MEHREISEQAIMDIIDKCNMPAFIMLEKSMQEFTNKVYVKQVLIKENAFEITDDSEEPALKDIEIYEKSDN